MDASNRTYLSIKYIYKIAPISFAALVLTACNQPASTPNSNGAGAVTLSPTSTSTTTTTTTTTTATTSNNNAIQIITRQDSTLGSFDSVAVPASGGTYATASRLYNLNGTTMLTTDRPTWFVEAKLFLTSTRTSAGAPTHSTSDTPCAYFDSYTDNNPESTGFYTIDGYNVGGSVTSDIDQCAGTSLAEAAQLAFYIKIDRRFTNSTDKFQIIVKAKPLDEPDTAPTTSSCIVGGLFDAANCANNVYTVSMRSGVGASAKPFYYLFPSAKALDLLAESVLLPTHIDSSINTISVDRVKGGAVIYGVTLIRIP